MIQRVILSEQVKQALLDDIIGGKFQPGDRLVESQIAKQMGISQSPVREALRDLVAMRFVELVPHKGARVRKFDTTEIFEIYPVRAQLEELAGRLAVKKAASRVGELETAVRNMHDAFLDKDAQTMAHWDVKFHRTILEASGNRILIETWDSLMIQARTFLTLRNLMSSKPELDLSSWHMPIIDAIREGNAEKCGHEMRQHVEDIGTIMQDILVDGGDVPAAQSAAE